MTLTYRMIDELRSNQGAFTSYTIARLGLTFPLKTGWMKRLVGKWMSDEDYRRAVATRNVTLKTGKALQIQDHSKLPSLACGDTGGRFPDGEQWKRELFWPIPPRPADWNKITNSAEWLKKWMRDHGVEEWGRRR